MTAYKKGFIDGMAAYAINKNGEQLVGNDRPLKTAIANAESTWNFDPPASEMRPIDEDVFAGLLVEAEISLEKEYNAFEPEFDNQSERYKKLHKLISRARRG